jgi:hypothetical protein
MLIYQILFAVLTLSIPAVGLIVASLDCGAWRSIFSSSFGACDCAE